MAIFCGPGAGDAAAELDGPTRAVPTLTDAAMTLAADPGEGLVVIGPGEDLAGVLDFARRLRDERPDVTVILLRDAVRPDDATAAAEAGVSEVLPVWDTALIRAACRRGDVEPEPAQPSGQVVTVFAPKGGSGKTTISTNLSVALHRRGARVCLVDLDLEFGDVAIALQLVPARTLVDATTGPKPDAYALLAETVTTTYQPGLDCVLAPIEPGHAERISAELVTSLLAELRRRYDYVVVDSPSQFTEQVLAALDASDLHVLLANPEIPSLKNLRLTLDMLDLLGYRREARVIAFNRDDVSAGLVASEVEATLHAPIAVSIPASRDVPASINHGVPIVAATPDHPVSRAVDRLATQFVMGQAVRSQRGLLARLIGRRSA